MKDSVDPPRLVDPGSPASDRLRRLIEDGRADVGTDADIQKLEAALVPMLWPGGAGPAGSGTASAAGAKGAAALAPKVAAAVALALAGASTLWLAASHGPPPAMHPAPSAATETLHPAVEAPAPPAPARALAPAPTIESQDLPSASGSAHRRALDSVSEADLLGQAQAVLASDPGRALALAEQHSRRFPHGVLTQEREVIAVEALARLGRRAEAAARAERFLQAFPTSAHRSKIESIIGGK
jgi:hypothetical protein